MNILNIIDTIYESQYFPTILIISIIILVVLFIAVIILGLKDSKKSKEPQKEILNDLKDITFDTVPEQEVIKEDVTFEIPVLTKNLENFKKSLEEEIEREENINVIKKTADTKEETKPTKILDKNKIDNTAVIPIIKVDKLETENEIPRVIKNDEKEEELRHPKREILKELFKDRKIKEIDPPKIKQEVAKENSENKFNQVNEKINSLQLHPKAKQNVQQIENMNKEIYKQEEIILNQKNSDIEKKETRYTVDDDF